MAEDRLHTVLRAQMRTHAEAKKLRVPIAIRRAMVDAVDHIWREIYAARRRKMKKR